MPLLFSRHPYPDTTFGLWLIDEDEAFFRRDLPLAPAEETELDTLKGVRRMEWLAARWLLHKFTGEAVRLPLAKDAFSKPFFPDAADLSCSLSHSHGIVGALLEHNGAGGCDIQVVVDKMAKLAHKFLSEPEWTFVHAFPQAQHLELYHIFWTAKESLYKAYGLKALDFRQHMGLSPFEWNGASGQTQGWVEKEDYRQDYRLLFEKIDLPDEGSLIWTICRPISSI